MDLPSKHILSVKDFERAHVERIFQIADQMKPYAHREKCNHALAGAILGNMFFEPSTRTRISFSCAFNQLGGNVSETTGFEQSSIAKGESLYDTARVLSGYSDVIVMRHPEIGSVEHFAQASRVPVINGGDGAGEHPTQALLDLYTIESELKRTGGSLDNLRIALIGDLRHGRAVHSLCQLLCLYKCPCVRLVSPADLSLAGELVEALRAGGSEVTESKGEDMRAHIGDVDIIYATRIQKERFKDPAEAEQYHALHHLNAEVYTRHCKPNTVIMHSMPRDSSSGRSDLDDDLNEHPNLAIFRQTDNGVLIRMALFALIFGVADRLREFERPLPWRAVHKE
jgi:aspartate carbamoyltransferase catalytic subunit